MVRFAVPEDAAQINRLRKQVNDLHVAGRPDLFKPGFSPEIQEYLNLYWNSEAHYAAVDEEAGRIAGMVMVDYIFRPEGPYSLERKFVHIAEIGVDPAFRRQGVGRRLMEFVKADAREKGYRRIELDVWAFNDALAFYEAEGFTVFRRFLEMDLN